MKLSLFTSDILQHLLYGLLASINNSSVRLTCTQSKQWKQETYFDEGVM